MDTARPADVPAIASILALNDDPNSIFNLCCGTADKIKLIAHQTERIAQSVADKTSTWLVYRDQTSGEVVSFAQWTTPDDGGSAGKLDGREAVEESREEAEEKYKARLMPGMNVKLCIDFKNAVEDMRSDAMQGRKYYVLQNLGTHTQWRRKGLARMLLSRLIEDAETDVVPVYLDTADEGPGRGLYEVLGFVKVGECTVNVTDNHGEVRGTHKHIAMIRPLGSSGRRWRIIHTKK